MKIFLRFLLALGALCLTGTGMLNAHAGQHARIRPSVVSPQLALHSWLGSEQHIRQLSFHTAPPRPVENTLRTTAPDSGDEDDQDEEEDGSVSEKTLAAGHAAAPFGFGPVPGCDGHSVSKGFADGRPVFASATRRFIRLRVIRI